MEIEVGEWVRTKRGTIDKIIKIYAEDTDLKNVVRGKNGIYWKEKIVKHSKNIKDLIEVGDIVECFVEEDVDGEDTIKYEVAAIDILDTNGNKINEIGICGEDGIEFIAFENIRSILTHEQYEQNCYRLEE